MTWTLKYNRCHWLEVLRLQQQYARAELNARLREDVVELDEPTNVTKFAIHTSELLRLPTRLRVGKRELVVPSPFKANTSGLVISRGDDGWQVTVFRDEVSLSGKRPGLQGPIDDAFISPFLCVRGTGQPWSPAVGTYADAALERFAAEWHCYFRGDLPVKDDTAVTADDLRTRNLILFGDPGSNRWIAKALPHLPLTWTKEALLLGGRECSARDHVPALIAPNPLPGGEDRYIVLNSGHTFRDAELAKLNYLLFPRWGDWAILQVDSTSKRTTPLEEQVVLAGYFDESWQATR